MASILKIIKSGGGGHGLLYPGPVTIHVARTAYIWSIYLVYLFGLFIAGTCQSVGKYSRSRITRSNHEQPGAIHEKVVCHDWSGTYILWYVA